MKKYSIFAILLLSNLIFAADSFESVAVIPSETGGEDVIYAVVNRTIDGSTVRYIEQFQPIDWYADEDMNDAYFVDCATDANDDLTHLEGETVAVWGDGTPDANTYTVTSGAITTDTSYTNETIGLPYTSVLETMPLLVYTDLGSSASQLTLLQDLILDVYETYDFSVGPNSSYTSTQSITSLETGLWPLMEYPRGRFREHGLYFTLDEPSPFTLRGFTAQAEVQYPD